MTTAYATASTKQFGTEIVAAPSAKYRRVVQQLYVNADTAMKVTIWSGYVDEIQSVYNDGTGGTFTLTYSGQESGNIAYNASAATLVTALELLSTITSVTATGAGTIGDPWLVSFVDPGGQNIALMTADDSLMTGETTGSVIAEDTAGAGTELASFHLGVDGVASLPYSHDGWAVCGAAEALGYVTDTTGNVVVLVGYDTVGGS